MKIVLLGTAYPYRGGLANLNERLSLQFQNEGNEAEIVTFTLQYPNFLFPGKTQYSDSPAPKNLKITRMVSSVNPFNWVSVGLKIKRMAPDYLVIPFWLPFMSPCFGTIARIARGNKHTRVVSIVHNIIPHEKRIGDKMFASYFVGSTDGFVTMSKSVLSDLDLFDAKKTKKFCRHPLYDNFGLPVSREEAARKLNLDPNFSYLLFFGLIRDYKGLDWMLKAFADSRIDKSKVKLLVAGEFYNNGEQYKAIEKELKLDGSVVWNTDFVPDEEVRYYFSLADLVVQPYKSATQSGVTQVAYHFEKPMLVTNVGGLAENVPDGKVGYVVEPSPASVADAVVRFLNERPNFTEGIQDEKKKYSWTNLTSALIEVGRSE